MVKGLPLFPNFEKLDIEHKEILQAIAKNFPSYSDFNFVSLFTWDVDGEVRVSSLYDNLIIRFTDYIDRKTFYSFLGTNRVDDVVETLVNYAKNNGEHSELMLVPHSSASLVSGEKHSVIEDRDNHDYMLSVNDLVEFKTNKYRGKKNLLNRFHKTYGENTVTKEVDLGIDENREEIKKVLSDWQTSRGKSSEEVDNEFAAIERGLTHADKLGLLAFGIYVKNKLVGFTLFEVLPNRVAVIHFDKADVRYVGVFEHLKHSFAKHLASLDVDTINYEQDLGVEGMRKAKESYHPTHYLKKYTIGAK